MVEQADFVLGAKEKKGWRPGGLLGHWRVLGFWSPGLGFLRQNWARVLVVPSLHRFAHCHLGDSDTRS